MNHCSFTLVWERRYHQSRNHGELPAKVFTSLEKYVGHSLKLLGIWKIWSPLRKLFAPPWCSKLVAGLVPTPLFSAIQPCPPATTFGQNFSSPRNQMFFYRAIFCCL